MTPTKPSSLLLLHWSQLFAFLGAFPLPPRTSGELSQEAPSLSVNAGMNMRAVNWLACINSLASAGRGGWTLHLECPALGFGEVVGGVGL